MKTKHSNAKLRSITSKLMICAAPLIILTGCSNLYGVSMPTGYTYHDAQERNNYVHGNKGAVPIDKKIYQRFTEEDGLAKPLHDPNRHTPVVTPIVVTPPAPAYAPVADVVIIDADVKVPAPQPVHRHDEMKKDMHKGHDHIMDHKPSEDGAPIQLTPVQ